jgi:asparagine synthase (glutamine-hydrolysing)
VCGITGIVERGGRPVSPVLLQRMTDALVHRGPDGEGVFTADSVGFGHRRLAVIDPSPAGHQPMVTADGAHALTYNGEVYNFQELRLELEALGHRFRSRTDSEVVLEAWAQWGADAVRRFNGMFAFAVYDRAHREVVLARDRFGIKPLYYTIQGNTVLFGSEVKAILEHPECTADVDREALVEYFTFQNFLTDRTLFRDIRLLPAGCVLRIPLGDDHSPAVERYWDYDFVEPDTTRDLKTDVEELDRLFCRAVSRQLVSDVPVASYLSGGMDTGAITAVASRQLSDLRTFTVGFDMSSASGLELGFDERSRAERMSYLCGTEHYEMVLKAGDMERAMRSVIWHMEEPRVGQSYPNYYAAKLAGSFGKVVLSGAGGDELFAGYPWRYYRAVVNDDFDDYIGKYYQFWQRLLPEDAARTFFRPAGEDSASVDPRSIFASVFRQRSRVQSPEEYINHSLYFEAKTFLHGLLVVEDKLSMAHSLETRLPFLDNDLVAFAMQVPVRFKLASLGDIAQLDENELMSKLERQSARTSDGKVILRDAMARYVPDDVVSGPKQGFTAPDASWFRGESIEYVRRVLLRGDARLFEYLDRATVHALVDDHLDGRENRRLLIWSLLCFEHWLQIFLGGS